MDATALPSKRAKTLEGQTRDRHVTAAPTSRQDGVSAVEGRAVGSYTRAQRGGVFREDAASESQRRETRRHISQVERTVWQGLET